jgi:nicotinamide-nucleotide amidase
MRPMFKDQVLPLLKEQLRTPLYAELLHVVGLGESTVEDRMIPVIEGFKSLSVAYCASPEYVRVFLTSPDKELLHQKTREVMALFKGELLSRDAKTLSEDVLFLLKRKRCKLAVAESCTGGIIAQRVTDIPGCSEVFNGGVVSYANAVKESVLGVGAELLEEHGAVSPECAAAMVEGVCAKLNAEAGIAVTGIAGPDGGSVEKPVGLVYAAARFEGRTVVRDFHLRGGREQIRHRAASNALNLLRRLILGLEGAEPEPKP